MWGGIYNEDLSFLRSDNCRGWEYEWKSSHATLSQRLLHFTMQLQLWSQWLLLSILPKISLSFPGCWEHISERMFIYNQHGFLPSLSSDWQLPLRWHIIIFACGRHNIYTHWSLSCPWLRTCWWHCWWLVVYINWSAREGGRARLLLLIRVSPIDWKRYWWGPGLAQHWQPGWILSPVDIENCTTGLSTLAGHS